MDRRQFIQKTSVGLSTLGLGIPFATKASGQDHPDIIEVVPQSDSLSLDLQAAFQQAYLLWSNDPASRRPVIRLPQGQFYIDDIVGNNRGNYPFHMPPTFKLVGAGAGNTHITCRQPRGSQYRFLMIYPNTRLDILAGCPSLAKTCVLSEVSALGPSYDIEISGITFNEFDNAISLKEARDCHIHDCEFNSSLVAVQLDMDHLHGNKGHKFERCKFDAKSVNGSLDRFCLRFEAPFSILWTDIEQGVQDLESCIELGGNRGDYSASAQTCVVPSDAKLNTYLSNLFGQNLEQDIGNRNCEILHCDFYHSSYSAIEFAGKLNIENLVSYCGFYQCHGTGVEFDKGASHNKVTHSVFSGLKPTTAFAPGIPYIFQAAVQEQEGSHSVDARIKTYITEAGFDNPASANYKGQDIFLRAASLPQGNEISHNQFDLGRSYYLSDIEPDTSKHAKLPDVYPSIKLRRSLDTKVLNNTEFNANPALKVNDDTTIGQSIVIYQNDDLREERGGIEIRNNLFGGAWYFVGTRDAWKDTRPMVVDNNTFGFDDGVSRGGVNLLYCYAENLVVSNNVFHCARNVNSTVIQKFDVTLLNLQNNRFEMPSINSFYLRSIETTQPRSNVSVVEGNTFNGGHAMYVYDYSAHPNAAGAQDQLKFNGNQINGLSGSGRVVAVTLWARDIEVNGNHFNNIENKIFQLYALSDQFSHDGMNALTLAASSQNRAYSRNYANTSGRYVTGEFWTN